jgi:hypothetical protein
MGFQCYTLPLDRGIYLQLKITLLQYFIRHINNIRNYFPTIFSHDILLSYF